MLNELILKLSREIDYNNKVDTQRAFDKNKVLRKQLKILEAAQAKLNKIGEE